MHVKKTKQMTKAKDILIILFTLVFLYFGYQITAYKYSQYKRKEELTVVQVDTTNAEYILNKNIETGYYNIGIGANHIFYSHSNDTFIGYNTIIGNCVPKILK